MTHFDQRWYMIFHVFDCNGKRKLGHNKKTPTVIVYNQHHRTTHLDCITCQAATSCWSSTTASNIKVVGHTILKSNRHAHIHIYLSLPQASLYPLQIEARLTQIQIQSTFCNLLCLMASLWNWFGCFQVTPRRPTDYVCNDHVCVLTTRSSKGKAAAASINESKQA